MIVFFGLYRELLGLHFFRIEPANSNPNPETQVRNPNSEPQDLHEAIALVASGAIDTLALSLSLSHTHTHTHTLSRSHTHFLFLSLSLSRSLTLSLSLSLSLSEPQDLHEAIELVASGAMNTIVDSTISLQDFQGDMSTLLPYTPSIFKFARHRFSNLHA